MARRKWTVIVEWENDVCEDADEIAVHAHTAAGAASIARSAWASDKTLSRDGTRLKKVFVLTSERLREFA